MEGYVSLWWPVGGTSGWIGLCCPDDQLASGKFLVCRPNSKEVLHFLDRNNFRTRTNIHPQLQHLHFQGLDDGLGLVGGRKDPTMVLDLEFDPIFLKKRIISWLSN